MVSQLTAAGAIVVLSLVIGQLTLRVAGRPEWSWTSGAIGLSMLMLVTAPAAWLPGRLIAPMTLIAVALMAAAVLAVRKPRGRLPWAGFAAALPAAGIAMVPFAANGRAGILGVNFNNDTAAHLLLIDAMHSAPVAEATPLLTYYPLGPHGVSALLATLGWPSAAALTGLTMAIPILLAITALTFVQRGSWLGRAVTVTLAAFPFLMASYFAQGAFKEPLMALLLVAIAAAADEAARSDRAGRLIPLGILCAGIVATYSYVGLAWPALAVAIGLLLRGVRALATRRVGQEFRQLAGWLLPLAIGCGVGFALLLPQLRRVQAFWDWSQTVGIAKTDIGNLAGPLDRDTMLGIWASPDFRHPSADTWWVSIGTVVVIGLLAGAVYWSLRQTRRSTLPLLGLACLATVFLTSDSQSPYTVAKAMVLCSPFVFLIIGRALTEGSAGRGLPVRIAALGVGGCVAAAALWSSGLALRGAQVGPTERAAELATFRPIISGKPTLYLGLDDFINWELQGAPVTQPMYGALAFEPSADKRWEYGQSFDADSIPETVFDQYAFAVVPRIATDSEMPENFVRVAATASYELYRRAGATAPRRVLSQEWHNGAAPLRCETPEGRRIARKTGVAAIRSEQKGVGIPPIHPRSNATVELDLSAGTWDLSLRYVSGRPVTVTAPGFRSVLPASLARLGSVWPAGTIKVAEDGPLAFTIAPEHLDLSVDATTAVAITELIAQKRGTQRIVPLKQACNRYIDWYRLPADRADTTNPATTGSPR